MIAKLVRRLLTVIVVLGVVAVTAADSSACWRWRCRRSTACQVVFCPPGTSDPTPPVPTDPDEEEYGKDLRKPGPLPEVPRIPSLEDLLKQTSNGEAPAGVVVRLPAGARLFVNGGATAQVSALCTLSPRPSRPGKTIPTSCGRTWSATVRS